MIPFQRPIYYRLQSKNHRLLLSILIGPKVITLSGFYCGYYLCSAVRQKAVATDDCGVHEGNDGHADRVLKVEEFHSWAREAKS